MQLLIIKDGKDYFRFSDSGYERCAMQKASVYPMDAVEKVEALLDGLRQEGVEGASIYRLTIIEEPYA